jgi:mono/diheme cytochrome c family protein
LSSKYFIRSRGDEQARKKQMSKQAAKWLTVAAVLSGLTSVAWTQDLDVGKIEYQSGCAACHGADGKGKGPLREQLKVAPTDLTVLSKKNNGVFPFNAVYETIYGIKVIVAHGTREMPIWGYRYSSDPNRAIGTSPADRYINLWYDPDAIVRTRILAVIDYLNRIQEK